MTTVTAGAGFFLDMTQGSFSDFNAGTVQSVTETEVVVQGTATYILTGKRFSGDNGSGLPTDGQINSFAIEMAGNPAGTIAGFQMGWQKFLDYAAADAFQRWQKRLLEEDDTITGNTLGDTALGFTGNDTIYGGDGDDKLYGGDDNDALYGGSDDDDLYGGQNLDSFDGGAGFDRVILASGDYFDPVTLEADDLTGVEVLRLSRHFDDVSLISNDGNVAAGETLVVNGATSGPTGFVHFDGSAETDGHFVFRDGAGDDILTGGALADEIRLVSGGSNSATGGGGADKIVCGGGSDTIVLASAADSNSSAVDVITQLNLDADKFDLPIAIGSVNVTTGSVSAATFDANMGSICSDYLCSVVNVTGGDLIGKSYLVVNADTGDGFQYHAGDYVMDITGYSGTPGMGDFI
jgi:Ca2+-binding RTX toxin-like protein